jgi:hypothetical protein
MCDNCGAVFEDYKIIKDPRPYGMGVAYEEYACCPHCQDTDIVEAKECSRCNGIFAKYELEDGLCEHCYGELYGE